MSALHWAGTISCLLLGAGAIYDPEDAGRLAGLMLMLWTVVRLMDEYARAAP